MACCAAWACAITPHQPTCCSWQPTLRRPALNANERGAALRLLAALCNDADAAQASIPSSENSCCARAEAR